MSLKHIFFIFINLSWSYAAWSTPAVEIVQSCKNQKPANASIVITELMQAGVIPDAGAGCEDLFEFKFNDHKYGSVICNNDPYLIIADRKYKLNVAENLSINPAIKPDTPLLLTSEFWKIDKNNESFLCILSPLDQSGAGASRIQYYIVENAFHPTLPVKMYFYFFDKDVSSLTSIE
jgi:hypothetical protein